LSEKICFVVSPIGAENSDKMLISNLLYWNVLNPFIREHENKVLMIAHKTVETRLHNANSYLDQLLKTYESSNSEFRFEYLFLRGTFTENIITNLCSALDALAHEIKIIYEIDIKNRSINFSHGQLRNTNKNNCLRCKLKDTDKELADSLDRLVLNQNNPVDNWCDALFEYRHHFIFMTTIGNILYLPDNPKISNSTETPKFDKVKMKPIIPNYTKQREIRKFSNQSIRIVLAIVEFIYGYIISEKIREKFFFDYHSKLKTNKS
jgi:hypothetical protein